MMLEGCVLACEGSSKDILAAFEATAVAVGYARTSEPADLGVEVYTSERGVAFSAEITKTFASAFAAKLAARLRRPVRVLGARLVEGPAAKDAIDCDVSDVLVAVDGAHSPGRWADDTIAEHGADWSQICDGKSYVAVFALLEDAREAALPGAARGEKLHLRAPASLGSPRLDDLAQQARLGARAVVSVIGGRPCLRITAAGATVTSFLEPAEAEALRGAIPGL